MFKRILLTVIAILGILGFITNSAFAYTIDGSLADWGNGVTAFSNWNPQNANVDYVVIDDKRPTYSGGGGDAPWGGEYYDVEAMYFNDDHDNIYFAMVSSYPQSGSLAGDLAISLNSGASYNYGVKIKGLSPSSTTLTANVMGLSTANWTFNGHTFDGPIYITSGAGTPLGTAELFYKNLGLVEGNYKYPTYPSVFGNTYLLEGRISKSLFGPLADGQTVDLHYSEWCGNDFINLSADIDTATVPEPATMSLLGLGLLGLLGLGKRKGEGKRNA